MRRRWRHCLTVLLTSSAAFAQVYRWVDEQGVIHLSSEKPRQA